VKLDVLLIHSWPGKTGGGTVDVLALTEGLVQRGHHTALVESSRLLRHELESRPGAIVHLFGCLPAYTPLAAMVLAKRRRRVLVWTPVIHPSRRRTWKGYGVLRAMQLFDTIAPRAARFVDAVIAATESEADYFRSLGARNVELIPPGVESPSIANRKDEVAKFRSRLRLNGGPVVLTVARDNSRKALPFGIEAFRQLRRERADAELLLVGANPDRWNGEPGVRCPGWLDPCDVELAYRTADVLFVPSLYEGLPRVVIEAWSFGLPVVATDRVALAPMIDGVGGRVVQFGDPREAANALSSLLVDPSLARRYGNAGRKLAEERFALKRSIDLTEALYMKLVS
jgi:glycosyltransferase involved in cell wall biosynthesis